jgi:ABC-type nitrate/sulfonate/bicarbonate transport system permease component
MTLRLAPITKRALVLFCVLIVWELTARVNNNVLFPPLSEILSSWPKILTMDFLTLQIIPTLTLFFGTYFLGSVLGVILGGVIGSHQLLYTLLTPHILFVRYIPTAARIPVIMGIFGVGWESLFAAVFLSSFINVLILTALGVAKVSTVTKENAHLLELTEFETTFRVLIPAAAGDVFAALQSTLQTTLMVVVLVESLASARGLGAYLLDAQYRFDIDQMWTTMIILGVIGYCCNQALVMFEHRVGKWYFSVKGAGENVSS